MTRTDHPDNKHMIYDVAVIGAGPAGSTAAYYLGQDPGLKVLIVDRWQFPRSKCCAGGLFLVEDWPQEFENFRRVMDKVTRFPCHDFHFFCGREHFFHTSGVHLFDVVDRAEFDAVLLDVALERGNVFFEKALIRGMSLQDGPQGGYYVLRSESREFYAYRVIGADGFKGVVNRYLGNGPAKPSDFGMCLQYEVCCSKIGDGATSVFLNWDEEVGFSWIFPNVQGYSLGIGLIGRTRKPLVKILDEFVAFAIERNLIPSEHEKQRFSGAPCPVSIARNLCDDRVLLCGDSMGAVRQLTGEGIYYAMKTGQIAAMSLKAGQGCVSARYRRELKPILKQITLFKRFPVGPMARFLLKVCVRVFSCRLPLGLHRALRQWIIDKFHRMDSLPPDSFYKVRPLQAGLKGEKK